MLISIIFFLAFSFSGYAQNAVYTPEAGSVERKEIMDAAREPIVRELSGQTIIFVVRKLRVINGWAYMEGVPQLKSGRKVDYSITKYKDDVRQGVFDEWAGVLLRKEGQDWKVKTHVFGATDYPVVVWPEEFGAPRELFQ